LTEKELANMEGILGIEKKNCCGFAVCGLNCKILIEYV